MDRKLGGGSGQFPGSTGRMERELGGSNGGQFGGSSGNGNRELGAGGDYPGFRGRVDRELGGAGPGNYGGSAASGDREVGGSGDYAGFTGRMERDLGGVGDYPVSMGRMDRDMGLMNSSYTGNETGIVSPSGPVGYAGGYSSPGAPGAYGIGQQQNREQPPAGTPTPSFVYNRKYPMESDIFGTGFGPSKHSIGQNFGMHIDSRAPDTNKTGRNRGMDMPAGMPSTMKVGQSQSRDHLEFERFEEARANARRNAREANGNPLTGEGYDEDRKVSSQKRQFRSTKSTPLW